MSLWRGLRDRAELREAFEWRWRALNERAVEQAARARCRARYGPRLWLERARHRRLHAEARPLVSVLIATYNRRELLIARALRSVRQQTYPRLEIIVVGDACTDDTAQAIAQLGDSRIVFRNLPQRGPYPDVPYHRWLVAGSAPGNEALRMARGHWIAWLDDDDEFTEDHVESLLDTCRTQRLEFAYGRMDMETKRDVWEPMGEFPPRIGKICHGAVFYAGYLRFMKYDLNCWRVGEPNDWNLWRRMLMTGVRFGFVPRIVGRHFLEGPLREQARGD